MLILNMMDTIFTELHKKQKLNWQFSPKLKPEYNYLLMLCNLLNSIILHYLLFLRWSIFGFVNKFIMKMELFLIQSKFIDYTRLNWWIYTTHKQKNIVTINRTRTICKIGSVHFCNVVHSITTYSDHLFQYSKNKKIKLWLFFKKVAHKEGFYILLIIDQ